MFLSMKDVKKSIFIPLFLGLWIGSLAAFLPAVIHITSGTFQIDGAHIKDSALNYELDIPPNWYVVIPPATVDEIVAFETALDNHYGDAQCKAALKSDDVNTGGDETRIFFIYFNPEHNCSRFTPTGVTVAAPGTMYKIIPMPAAIQLLQENKSLMGGLIDAQLQVTGNGIPVGILKFDAKTFEEDKAFSDGIITFHIFTTRSGLVGIGIFSPINQEEEIKSDINIILSSIKIMDPEDNK